MKVNPNDPAYPGNWPEMHGVDAYQRHSEGVPIRLAIAAQALSGLIANSVEGTIYKADGKACKTMAEVGSRYAELSLGYADALIAAYNAGG